MSQETTKIPMKKQYSKVLYYSKLVDDYFQEHQTVPNMKTFQKLGGSCHFIIVHFRGYAAFLESLGYAEYIPHRGRKYLYELYDIDGNYVDEGTLKQLHQKYFSYLPISTFRQAVAEENSINGYDIFKVDED